MNNSFVKFKSNYELCHMLPELLMDTKVQSKETIHHSFHALFTNIFIHFETKSAPELKFSKRYNYTHIQICYVYVCVCFRTLVIAKSIIMS